MKKVKDESEYWLCSCGERYDIRHKNSFYRYCHACHKSVRMAAKCPTCGANVDFNQVERIIEYICQDDPAHRGIFYKNGHIYLKDLHES